MNLSKKGYILVALVILLTAFFLYRSSLNYYFFQDDFFEINISRANKFSEYLNFYKFRGDIIAYRPISLQNYFFISRTIFGLNALGFRLITFSLFFLSFFLIMRVIQKITLDKRIGLLTGFLWLTSSIHFMALTWVAAAYNIIGTFFWLLTSLFFLKFLKRTSRKYYLASVFLFIVTVGSYEFSVTWPAIFGFYYFFVLKNPIERSIKVFSPFILITLTYLVLKSTLMKIPSQVEYQVAFNFESVKAFFWYFLWSLNIPEEFKKQTVANFLVFNPKFFAEFWPLITKTFIGALLILLITIVGPLIRILQKRIIVKNQMIAFGIFWFVAAISPVLVLPNHTFSMYLTLSSIGLYLTFSYLLVNYGVPKLALPLILVWLATSVTTLSFYKINSWMINAQKTTYDAKVNLIQSFPQLPSNSVVLYPVNSHWEKQALSGNDFVRMIYDDPSLLIYYNKYDLIYDFKKGLTFPINVYVPK